MHLMYVILQDDDGYWYRLERQGNIVALHHVANDSRLAWWSIDPDLTGLERFVKRIQNYTETSTDQEQLKRIVQFVATDGHDYGTTPLGKEQHRSPTSLGAPIKNPSAASVVERKDAYDQ